MLQVFGAGAVKDFLFHYFTTFLFLSASCGSADSKIKKNGILSFAFT